MVTYVTVKGENPRKIQWRQRSMVLKNGILFGQIDKISDMFKIIYIIIGDILKVFINIRSFKLHNFYYGRFISDDMYSVNDQEAWKIRCNLIDKIVLVTTEKN